MDEYPILTKQDILNTVEYLDFGSLENVIMSSDVIYEPRKCYTNINYIPVGKLIFKENELYSYCLYDINKHITEWMYKSIMAVADNNRPTTFNGLFPISGTNVDYIPAKGYSHYYYDINEPAVEEAKKCTCGATKTYPNEPNLEFLHSYWCDLYKPNK